MLLYSSLLLNLVRDLSRFLLSCGETCNLYFYTSTTHIAPFLSTGLESSADTLPLGGSDTHWLQRYNDYKMSVPLKTKSAILEQQIGNYHLFKNLKGAERGEGAFPSQNV